MSQSQAISDDRVASELNKMVEFIKREADEKAREIEDRANEDYQIELSNIVRTETAAIDQFYERKYKEAALNQQIQKSSIANKMRLKVLAARDDVLSDILNVAAEKLKGSSKDSNYQKVLEGLIEEGLVALMEDTVSIQVREQDKDVAKKAADGAAKSFEDKSGIKTTINVSDKYLPSGVSGGVIITNKTGKIEVNNTLDERLNLLSQSSLPAIRLAVFGPSESRKFFD